MRNLLSVAFAAAIILFALSEPATAGGSCTQRQIGVTEIRNAFNIAARTRDYLEQSGAKLAIVSRVGSDISEQGLRYTHAGFVLRDHPKGRWLFVHLLNECGADSSNIYDEGLINFYLDDLFAFEGVIHIPHPELQDRLTVILSGPRAVQLHHSAYSMIAKPTATKYQNSNQWVLETLAMAQAPEGVVNTRAQAQQFYASHGYRADTVRVSDFQRFGAGLTRANVRFDDHTAEEASNRRYEVVTVRSVANYLETNKLVSAKAVITLDKPPQVPTRY